MALSAPETDPDLKAFISEYYGKRLSTSADLNTNACCTSGPPPAFIAAAAPDIRELP